MYDTHTPTHVHIHNIKRHIIVPFSLLHLHTVSILYLKRFRVYSFSHSTADSFESRYHSIQRYDPYSIPNHSFLRTNDDYNNM